MAQHHSYLKRPSAIAWRTSAVIPWRVPQLCASYQIPQNLPGGGVIGIVELGGGWSWNDVGRFFGGINMPVPKIGDFSVDAGAGNSPGSDADAEVALDIQIAGAVYTYATGRPATIRVYWANNDLDAIMRCVQRATADGCDVCSISWGSDEANWGADAAVRLENTVMSGVAIGMITFAASGDNDSSDGGPGAANVDLPASALHVIGCGGTKRPHNPSLAHPEVVWNHNPGNPDGEGTGGGYSTIWPMPPWMAGAPGTMRMVPDLAANADPNTGYHITLNGIDIVVGGTSAVAPLYAGLFAAMGRKLGFVAPTLWQNHLAFNDITKGDNGKYRAWSGPDPCTGLGSPRGTKIAALFG